MGITSCSHAQPKGWGKQLMKIKNLGSGITTPRLDESVHHITTDVQAHSERNMCIIRCDRCTKIFLVELV